MPDMTIETRWLRSPYVGVPSLRVLKQISSMSQKVSLVGDRRMGPRDIHSASLSMQKVSSEFSTS